MSFKNKEHAKAYYAGWRKRNAAKVRVAKQEWYLQHKDVTKQRARAWGKANPEALHKSQRKWAKENADHIKQHNKETPEVHVAAWHRRETKRRSNGGSFTAQEWNALCKKYGNKCLCCKRRRKLTADHVIPVSKGGTSNIENIQPLCGPCNSSKGTKTTDYRNQQHPASPVNDGGEKQPCRST